MKAKKAPIAKIPNEKRYIHSDVRRILIQACANAGSTGHGSLIARHCIKPATINIMAAVKNTGSLCSENHTSCGTFAINDDNAAPAPTATSSAGIAQQINVPPLVNNASSEAARVGLKLSISANLFLLQSRSNSSGRVIDSFHFHNIVTGIFN